MLEGVEVGSSVGSQFLLHHQRSHAGLGSLLHHLEDVAGDVGVPQDLLILYQLIVELIVLGQSRHVQVEH